MYYTFFYKIELMNINIFLKISHLMLGKPHSSFKDSNFFFKSRTLVLMDEMFLGVLLNVGVFNNFRRPSAVFSIGSWPKMRRLRVFSSSKLNFTLTGDTTLTLRKLSPNTDVGDWGSRSLSLTRKKIKITK